MTSTATRKRTSPARVAVLACVLAATCLWGQNKPKPGEAYALISGTVFLDSGQAVPGAVVVLSPKDQPRKKLQEQTSSPRGEFAFRVPPGPGFYVLTASRKGFDPASKEVEIVAQEQVHKTLLLNPASK